MRIAICADLHLGNHQVFGGPVVAGINSRCRLTLETLEAAVVKAEDLECDFFVIAGDVYDTERPLQQLVAETQDILARPGQKIVIKGNHDHFSELAGDHSLGSLTALDMVRVVGESETFIKSSDQGVCDLWLIPYHPGQASVWLPREIKKLADFKLAEGMPRVLITHVGIIDSGTPPWLLDSHDALPLEQIRDLCLQYKIDIFAAGNWHNRKLWTGITPVRESVAGHDSSLDLKIMRKDGPLIMQIGTLCPTGFDNPGTNDYGTLAVIDTDDQTLTSYEIHGPRFIKWDLTAPGSLRAAIEQNMISRCCEDEGCAGNTVFTSFNVRNDDYDEALRFRDQLVTSKLIAGGRVSRDREETETATRAAVAEVKSEMSLEQGVHSFVETMQIDPKATRPGIYNRIMNFLRN